MKRNNVEIKKPTPEQAEILKKYKKRNQLLSLWIQLRKNKLAVIGLVILAIVVIVAILAPVLYDYESVVINANYDNRLLSPAEGFAKGYLLGTDEMGRDLLARIIWGGRTSLTIAAAAVILSCVVGSVLGAVRGFFGKWIDSIIMRICDIMLAVPNMLLALALVAAFGSSKMNLIVAIAISNVPRFARIMRSSVITIRDAEYVEAARAAGAKNSTIILREVVPNSLSSLIIQISNEIAFAIILISGLGFIGLGIQAPVPEWGTMLSAARDYLRGDAYLMLYPGIAIIITVMSMNLLGDGLRDALDPRLKQ